MVLEGLRRWRRRQRAALRQSNHPSVHSAEDGQGSGASPHPGEPDLISAVLPTQKPSSPSRPDHGAGHVPGAAESARRAAALTQDDGDAARAGTSPGSGFSSDRSGSDRSGSDRPAGGVVAPSSATAVAMSNGKEPARSFGSAGKPLNRQSPFYVGFVGALGVLVAYGLWGAIGQMGEVFTLLLVAMFLTLSLDPIVQFLSRRGLGRGWSVALVFFALVAVFVGVGLIVVPPVAEQGGQLAKLAPGYFNDLLAKGWVKDLDTHYHIITKLQSEVRSRLSDGSFLTGVFGGVLGAGRAVVSGFFAFFTVLVLTLYFLGALPSVKRAAYAIVPVSRRERVTSLSEEVFRRVGSYAIGQVAIASVNAVMSFVMMKIVGVPYPAVLAVAVGFLGLVPMVGAGLGAVVVCTVAVFDEPHKAVIALIYYIVYQQIENYVIVPRMMQRTVSVPGAVTIVAALAGGTLLGMLGALLAIPVAAGLLLLYEEVLIPRQRDY